MDENSKSIVIDSRAMDRITDLARAQFRDQAKPEPIGVIYARCIHTYITQQGGTPGFDVKF